MKQARVVSVTNPGLAGFGYEWKWLTEDGRTQSSTTFAYFYECVEDARRNGFTVELVPAGALNGGFELGLK